MLKDNVIRHIAMAMHSAHSTPALLAALQEVLCGLGCSGAYTVLFSAAHGASAEVYHSTQAAVQAGPLLLVKPCTAVAALGHDSPIYFETLQSMREGDQELKAGVIAPLQADGENYGALLLHEVIPESIRPLVACLAEQFGLALLRLQFQEELQQRHSIDAAKMGAVTETSKVLHELDLDIVLAKLMELALSAVAAEVGCIALRDVDDATLTCRVEWGLDDAALEKLRFKEGQTLADRVLHEKMPVILPHVERDQPFLPEPIVQGIRNLVALPLTTRTGVLGCLVVLNLAASSQQDIELLQTIVDLSRTAIDNALLHREALEKEALREQLRIAGRIQRRLLPQTALAMKGVQMAAWCMPCDESGGDYYDLFQFDEYRLGFVVGDATGHGIGAALMATTVRALLRALVGSTDDLTQLFGQLNNLAATDFSESKFVTLFYGVYDTRYRILTYASAGHRPPLILYRRAQDAFEYLPGTGIPLGIFAGAPYDQKATTPLDVGDIMLLLTDGVEEAPCNTGECFGTERLLAVVRTHGEADPAALIEQICQEVRAFCGPVPQKDDITLLCLRVTED